ncbi:MAG TPA: DNA-formamidopyrimidine glycosylase [Porticoccaceae bacterium]|nr:DNA-formamidopyrimidine glycosylase [Porticoccaceae bacterium]
MPELPEVETTVRGIAPHVSGHTITDAVVRNSALRWPVPATLPVILRQRRVRAVTRRGKYILFGLDTGTLLMHLGMSGSIRMVPSELAPGLHDHVDILFDNGQVLRFNDPRRFGALLWVEGDPLHHELLTHLGPEPLTGDFNGDYIFGVARHRKTPVKSLLMNSQVVVGVGNIYANEALFASGIHPLRKANRIALARYDMLVSAVKAVLESAIAQGGTTLRDFIGSDGRPGYFRQSLKVYGRGGEACVRCRTLLREVRLSNRSTVYCIQCQR